MSGLQALTNLPTAVCFWTRRLAGRRRPCKWEMRSDWWIDLADSMAPCTQPTVEATTDPPGSRPRSTWLSHICKEFVVSLRQFCGRTWSENRHWVARRPLQITRRRRFWWWCNHWYWHWWILVAFVYCTGTALAVKLIMQYWLCC